MAGFFERLFVEKLFGGQAEAADLTATVIPRPLRRPNPQRIGARRSLAKMAAKNMAFGSEDGKYRMFEARSDTGIRRLLGCGPTLNVDGTPMVGDTGIDERGKPYGVTEDFG